MKREHLDDGVHVSIDDQGHVRLEGIKAGESAIYLTPVAIGKLVDYAHRNRLVRR